MGRHRKEQVKVNVNITIDPTIKEKLKTLGINMSQLFTDAAIKEIERLENEIKPSTE